MLAPALALVFLALLVFVLSNWLRQSTGLPQGRVVFSDTGAWRRNEQSLFSKRYRVVGKPDYLIKDGDGNRGEFVPVEVKSSPAPNQPRPGHILQLATYCLLVEETYGVRPRYGIIQYADKQFAIDYTPELERELLRVVGAMREDLHKQDAHRNHNDARRCATCGVQEACEERLTR
ncbi:MAG: Dna2/Cas4 domain-containing protein [Anaerolineae bacterium]|nr:Dna2/Cas4 domain-containing protein [Anaerolineae bacterium]